jgi:hypothetical protein
MGQKDEYLEGEHYELPDNCDEFVRMEEPSKNLGRTNIKEYDKFIDCLECPLDECVLEKNFEGNELDCPLQVQNNSEYATVRELAVILDTSYYTIYGNLKKLKGLVRHKKAKNPRNNRSALYLHKEDVIKSWGRVYAKQKRKEGERRKIGFEVLASEWKELKEMAESRNIPLAGLINEIVVRHLKNI